MSRKIHIISNRLPFSISEHKKNVILKPSVGGLATGMSSVYKKYGGKWIGWSGVSCDGPRCKKLESAATLFEKEDCLPVNLTRKEIKGFYEGFSNKTLWPLFHYFTQFAEFRAEDWEAYVAVNRKFAETALSVVADGDILWVHDYQLLLVPEMIKEKKPNVLIGFFLHIPFPSFEVFRILPWRDEILKGMLGADLVGFHIYDYERHFFSSIRRLLGYEISFNRIILDDRVILADTFPMGIDFKKFENAAINFYKKEGLESTIHNEMECFKENYANRKLILSIDRLDYTKGLQLRLNAFDRFLEKYPQYIGTVSLIMLAVPSRNNVDSYKKLKSEVDELVGKINGKYGMINYQPIRYFYRSLPFESLIELYCTCSIAMITPIRDGMNLVAKEYIACRIDDTGVMILSEMAGVIKEMGEAIIINPSNCEMVADSIKQALTMPVEEQKEKIRTIKNRIRSYDVYSWASTFVDTLESVETLQKKYNSKYIYPNVAKYLKERIAAAERRAVFLDYDGTLTPFVKDPQMAAPDKELGNIINEISEDERNNLTIISGRDKETLERWFGMYDINLVAEHGVWLKEKGNDWIKIAAVSNKWMPYVRPIMESFVVRTPGSFIETKNYSLVWHYRNAEIEQSDLRANELKEALSSMILNHNLEILEGNKVIEVKNGGINKGSAAMHVLGNKQYDEIIAIGDDWTDEYMFRYLPKKSITIKRGSSNSNAIYKVDTVKAVRKLLSQLF